MKFNITYTFPYNNERRSMRRQRCDVTLLAAHESWKCSEKSMTTLERPSLILCLLFMHAKEFTIEYIFNSMILRLMHLEIY